MDMSDALWQQMQQPDEDVELAFPTAVFPAEQVAAPTAEL